MIPAAVARRVSKGPEGCSQGVAVVTAQAHVEKVLAVVTEGLRPEVETAMAAALGADWPSRTSARLYKNAGQVTIDAQALLGILLAEFERVFRERLGRDGRTLAHDLLGVRNKWAHREPLTPEDAYRAADTAERLLRLFRSPAAESASAIRQQCLAELSAAAERSHQQAGDTSAVANGRLAIVACTKAKLRHPAPAAELYSPSRLFTLSLAQVQSDGLPYMILSTKYGLVPPERELEPYELSLKDMSPVQRQDWDQMIGRQIDEVVERSRIREVVFLAGAEYRDSVRHLLERRGVGTRVHPRWQAICDAAFR